MSSEFLLIAENFSEDEMDKVYDVGENPEPGDRVVEIVGAIWNSYGGEYDAEDVRGLTDYVCENWDSMNYSDLVQKVAEFEEAEGSPEYLENFEFL